MTWVIRGAESKVEEGMGDDGYITKPVGPSEILTKVETMLASGSRVVHGQS
jgi:DNA-binding response OmpR family regulator